MVVVQPYKGKATIEQIGSDTKITIPIGRKLARIILLVFYLAIAAFILISSLRDLPFNVRNPAIWSMLVILGLPSLFSLVTLLWILFGKEIITISSATLAINKTLLGARVGKTYDRSSLQDVRVSPYVPSNQWDSGVFYWGWTGGVIAFDYGAKTIRCAMGIDEAEAKQILDTLRSRNLL